MDKLQVAQILDEIGDLLEMKDVEFKPRAYHKAAMVVRNLSKKLEEVEDLTELPGVGESIAKKIRELMETGELEYYEKLKKQFPIDYEALLSVEGLGPKTIKKLYKKLGIKNLDDLEEAAKKHEIRGLEGFGEKSEQNILENIEFAKQKTKRKLLAYAEPVAQRIIQKMKEDQNVKKISVAGSLRRKKETIGDLDVLVTTKEPEPVMKRFTSLETGSKIIAEGPTKSTIKLENGMNCDLRIIKPISWGSALMYFTGSKQHNIQVRKIAMKKGYKLNEYGLFKGEKRIAGKTEEEVYKKLGLQYTPPELRENRGEVGAAQNNELPKLVSYDALKGDLQMHTKWSDGDHSIKQMAEKAKQLGHEYVAITDHTGTLRIAGGLTAKEMKKYVKKIDEVDEQVKGIKVLKGAEVNIDSKGELDMKDSILKKLDVVVAGVHSGFRQSEQKITNRITTAMEHESVNIIAHPTGRKINSREPYKVDVEKLFKKSKETNTFLEIDSYPDRLDLKDVHVKQAVNNGCRIVINTDAHNAEQLRYIKYGIATARRGWATKKHVLNTLPLKKLLEEMKK